MFFVSDPAALYQIVVKDQHIFTETRTFISSNSLTFGPGLLATEGDMHRRQRKMLNPVFSTAHMRDIAPIIYPIAHKVESSLHCARCFDLTVCTSSLFHCIYFRSSVMRLPTASKPAMSRSTYCTGCPAQHWS